jgi:redox-sensitive bicupin YhaK (pirin superfamily)
MIAIRRGKDRGTTRIGWLHSRHSFSFGDYFDSKQMGFRTLRVINDDRVSPDQGFGTHGHRDMEILTYVMEGSLEHRDSLGTGSVMRRGDVQRMTAGAGIRHSEFNPSKTEPVHFLQIWIMPERNDLSPEYEQRHFTDAEKRSQMRLIASQDGRDGSLTIHQDVDLFGTLLAAGDRASHRLRSGRHAWLQVVKGELTVKARDLTTGDGASFSDEANLEITAEKEAEFLLFDLT